LERKIGKRGGKEVEENLENLENDYRS
jgi:hypothetical protein